MNKQGETSRTITSSISNQVNQSRTQPATYAHQKRKTPPQQTTVAQTQQNQQQQLVAVTSEEEKAVAEQTTSVVYQLEGGELSGNVVYQLDESLLAASDANIVYQLPDGTTVSPSELQGNMLYQVLLLIGIKYIIFLIIYFCFDWIKIFYKIDNKLIKSRIKNNNFIIGCCR